MTTSTSDPRAPFDWSATPLGRPETWSPALEAAIRAHLGDGAGTGPGRVEGHYRALFERTQAMVSLFEVVRNPEGTIVDRRFLDGNPSWFRGVNAKDFQSVRGRRLSEIIGPDLAEVSLPFVRHVMETGRVASTEMTLGGVSWLLTYAPLDRDCYVTTGQDMTSLKASEQALRDANARLRARNLDLDTFNQSVAHDLRGPIRVIGSVARLLLGRCAGSLDEQGRTDLERINRSADRVAEILRALQRLAKISDGSVNPVDVDLSTVLRNKADELRLADLRRRVAFHIQEGIRVRMDPGMALVLVENLLQNAWKFTSQTLEARIECRTYHGRDAVVLAMKDNGVGFDRTQRKRLFNPFQRLHTAEAFAGSGLGLAIVRRIVERHGGTVRADSRPQGGASIFVVLPDPDGRVRG
jgi:signal transduction histidine kinase